MLAGVYVRISVARCAVKGNQVLQTEGFMEV